MVRLNFVTIGIIKVSTFLTAEICPNLLSPLYMADLAVQDDGFRNSGTFCGKNGELPLLTANTDAIIGEKRYAGLV